ncbi:MAG: hypothetical protein ACO4B3_03525 [Planctomycetota bacterium]
MRWFIPFMPACITFGPAMMVIGGETGSVIFAFALSAALVWMFRFQLDLNARVVALEAQLARAGQAGEETARVQEQS